jgi:hypothetical protein
MIDFTQYELLSAVAIPIVLAITQALKFRWVKSEYIPFVSILVGIGVSFLLIAGAATNIRNVILSGILFGLSATGLYSGIQTTQTAILRIRAEKLKGKRNHG